MTKLIVIASTIDEVVIVTPRSRHGARGVEAESFTLADSMIDHPDLPDIIDEVEPTIRGAAAPHARRQITYIRELINFRRRRSVL